LYAIYCQNKPHSEEVWQEHGLNCTFLKTIQQNLGHRLPLDTYLLKPVQRISKYQLLLKEMLKYNTRVHEKQYIERAMVSMLDVVNNLNDAMHASFIVGCTSIKLQGRLLKRDQLQMTKYKRSSKSSMVNRLKLAETSSKEIELFLYEKALIICKRKSDDSTLGSSTLSPYSSTSTISSHSFANFVNGLNYSFYYQFKELLKVSLSYLN
jgi:GTPase involved in cell partitioning and DNA repair